MIHRLHHMIGSPECSTEKDGRWVRAVPMPFYGGLFDRARDAWAVLTERAFAVRWPEPGEFEAAANHRLVPRRPVEEQRTRFGSDRRPTVMLDGRGPAAPTNPEDAA